MANWNSEIAASQHDASNALNTQISGRNREGSIQGNYNSAVGGIVSSGEQPNIPGFDMFGSHGYDIVGIKGSEVNRICESIRTYVSNIDSYLTGVLETDKAEAKTAFRGTEAVDAVLKYLDKVQEYISNLTSQLLSFSDKVADVGNAWNQAQANIGSTVNASTGSFSAGSKYTEQVQYTGGQN